MEKESKLETENSFTLGVIGVAVSGPEETNYGLAKLLIRPGRETTAFGWTETANTAV